MHDLKTLRQRQEMQEISSANPKPGPSGLVQSCAAGYAGSWESPDFYNQLGIRIHILLAPALPTAG